MGETFFKLNFYSASVNSRILHVYRVVTTKSKYQDTLCVPTETILCKREILLTVKSRLHHFYFLEAKVLWEQKII